MAGLKRKLEIIDSPTGRIIITEEYETICFEWVNPDQPKRKKQKVELDTSEHIIKLHEKIRKLEKENEKLKRRLRDKEAVWVYKMAMQLQ
jgi:flagellar motility protein MotE (MotC chaperone)